MAEALDIDAEGSRPEQSNPVNMPSALRHGSVPVSKQYDNFLGNQLPL